MQELIKGWDKKEGTILDTYRGKGMQEDECITNVLTYSLTDSAGNAIAPESITGVGNYSVTFTVTDQWEKTTEKQVPILVENKDDYRKTHYYTRFISLDYLWTLAPDSKWNEEELRSLMINPTPGATIDLTHADVKEIQRIALEGGYLQSKEQTEAVIREVTAKYVDAAFDATGH